MSARRRAGRRGQSAVLIALALFAMLLLLAMATNIGAVVNDRIRVQSTADLSTYAVAYSEAASLNELVVLNKNIADAVRTCRQVLEVPLWPETVPCGCSPNSQLAELAVQSCKVGIDVAIAAFVLRANYVPTVGRALSAGRATADRNFTGVDISFFEMFPGSPTAMGTYWLRGAFNLAGPIVEPSIADIDQVSDTALNYRVFVTCPVGTACVPVPPMLGPTTYVNSWFYKHERAPTIWVAGRASGTPEKQFLDTAFSSGGSDGGYFGGSSTGGDDTLFAYAVAKPYAGSIGPSELSGNQQNGNMTNLGVYASRGTTYPKLSMYDEYRARLAGVNEFSGGTTPSSLIALDGYMNGKWWDMSRFKH